MPASTWTWGSGNCRPRGELCSAQLGLEGILEHPGRAIATVIAGTVRTDLSRDKQMWKSPGIKDIRPLRMPKKTRWRQKGESSWGEDAGQVRAEAEVRGTGIARTTACSWPSATKVTWIQGSRRAMIETERAGAGVEQSLAPPGL